jgi:phage tail sheath protein FI
MSLNLGVNLVEVDGATPSLQGAPTSVAGFVIRAQRGVPGVVRQVSSFSQFADYFGDYVKSGNSQGTQTSYVGAYALRGFFDNGGALAYVLPVVGKDAKAASAVFAAAAGGGAGGGGGGAGGGGGGGAGGGGAGAGGPGAAAALTVTAGFRGAADPGAWGNALAVRIVGNSSNPGVTDAFDLIVARMVTVNGTPTPQVVETWTNLSMSGAKHYRQPSALNDPQTGSKFIMVAASGAAAPAPTTGAATWTALTSGADDALSGAALTTALTAPFTTPSPFDSLAIQLMACPESADPAIVNAALTYCVNRGDCMFVGHAPENVAAKSYGQSLQGDNVYGAIYTPFIQVLDPVGSLIWIPPTGHVLGVYARTEQQRGIWKAPAGNGARVANALDVRTTFNDADHTDLVKNGSVNAIRPIHGAGIVIDSSRTLSTNPLWLYVNVRLLFNFVKSSLRDGLRWVVQEPNDPTLWNKVKYNSITPFLLGLHRAGAFGPGAAANVFRVKIDADNNPPANIQQGLLNIEVYFYPSRPAETILITVGQQEGAASASES